MSYLQPKASICSAITEISRQPFLTGSCPHEQTQEWTPDTCNLSLGSLCRTHGWTDTNGTPPAASASWVTARKERCPDHLAQRTTAGEELPKNGEQWPKEATCLQRQLVNAVLRTPGEAGSLIRGLQSISPGLELTEARCTQIGKKRISQCWLTIA